MDDPLAQGVAGVDLFGSMWEDLGYKAITELSTMSDGFNSTVNSADQLNSIKYDSFGEALAGLKRQLETNVLLPALKVLTSS